MMQEIKTIILQCDVCKRCKGQNVAYLRLMQPFPEPLHSYNHVTMDFNEGRLPLHEKSAILVIVDILLNMGIFWDYLIHL